MQKAVIQLRPARSDEALHLTGLCLRAKAVWGYGEDFLNACRAELAIDAEAIASSHLTVAEQDGEIVGLAQLAIRGDMAELDKLFVEPGRLRSGAGRALFEWAKSEARQSGAKVLVIDADPNAVDFYHRMGAIDAGVTPSESISGRLIPRLRLDL